MAAVVKGLILLVFVASIVEGRVLNMYSSDDELISDGIEKQELGVGVNTKSCPAACTQQYGFLPCAENTAGYVYLIVVYQVLLEIGGRVIGRGSDVLFLITGTGKLGGIFFRFLMALPSMMLMILSGIFGSKEEAQSQVSVGVGIYAGITVFSLTIQWGICIIYGKTDLEKKSDEPSGILGSITSPLKDTGVNIDKRTCDIAGFMLLSLIPYVVLQLVVVFNTLSGKRIITLIALIVSSLSLLSYFAYQIWRPWMQDRSLSYSDKIMNSFDKNNDGKITEEEFIQGFKTWAERSASDNNDVNKDLCRQLLNQLEKDKENNSQQMDRIMSKILKRVEGQLLNSESLITERGEANIRSIKELFKELDTNGDNNISAHDLKKLVARVNFRSYRLNEEDVVEDIFEEFDQNRDMLIDSAEFVKGVTKYLDKAIQAARTSEIDGATIIQEFDRITWKGTDTHTQYGMWDVLRSGVQVLSGILILTFLGKPLTANILQVSHAMGFPSFIISFVVVPLTINARSALAAILPASTKSIKTASWTFSEIYGGVIMNNMAGLTTLLVIVYAKELRWDFSAEVMTIVLVCGTIGTLAFFRTTYQLWTCILAFFLYPISLALFYFLQFAYSSN